jgi:hypothetical protein
MTTSLSTLTLGIILELSQFDELVVWRQQQQHLYAHEMQQMCYVLCFMALCIVQAVLSEG